MPTDTPPPLRVLLVEDYPELAEATAALLMREGLDVRTALSGNEALQTASTFQPQLILCDLKLPDMTGLEVASRLRSNPATERTYVVLLTAFRREELSHQIDSGQPRIDAILSKPLTLEAIRTLVERLTPRPVNDGQT
jgi:CheY-like chemotaxis protein